jgi:hypothetical protein
MSDAMTSDTFLSRLPRASSRRASACVRCGSQFARGLGDPTTLTPMHRWSDEIVSSRRQPSSATPSKVAPFAWLARMPLACSLASILIPCHRPLMRYVHRTIVARCFAVCLLALAASPVTAPFTTCELSDFTTQHPSPVPHPGRQVAAPDLKVPLHAIMAPPVMTAMVVSPGSERRAPWPGADVLAAPSTRRTVLRL